MLNNENKKWGLSRINEFTDSARAVVMRCSCTLTAMLCVDRGLAAATTDVRLANHKFQQLYLSMIP